MRGKRDEGERRWKGPTLVLAVFLGLLVGWVGDLQAAQETFPKLANIYFPTLIGAELEALAKWDVLVLPKRAQSWYREELSTLRELNPDIVILVHMPVGYNGAWDGPEDNAVLTNKLDACDWWLRDTAGEKVMINGGDALIDATTNCSTDSQGKRLCEWLPEYIAERLGPGGWWDGVYLDYCMDRIHWINSYSPDPIDSDLDGVGDAREQLNAGWREGMKILTAKLRALVGDEYIIVTNGNNTCYESCDGGTREGFPNGHGDWYENITNEEYGYLAIETNYRKPAANIINSIWSGPATLGGPVRTPEFERTFGFVYASTLVFGDGYFSLDGPSHSQIWWHEDYEIDLGRAKGGCAKARATPGSGPGIENGEMIRVRRFESGIAVVNPSSSSQLIHLNGVYYDPSEWNGSFYPHCASTMSVDLEPESGAILAGSGRMICNAGGLEGARVSGVNWLEWNRVEGASSYSIYRVDVAGGTAGQEVLVAVVEEPFFEDASAKTSVSRYFVAAIDENGCEGQASRPVEVSSGLGSDLSLALVVLDELDGTLALSWSQEDIVDGVVFDVVRSGEAGDRVVMTDQPIDPTETARWVDTNVVPGEDYLYEAVSDRDGLEVVIGSVVGGVPEEQTRRTSLRGCYPHPMVSSTTFAFDVGNERRGGAISASLTVYDTAGRVVRRLLNESVEPGSHSVDWDGTSESGERVASGCYLYALTAGDETHSGKVLVVR